MAEIVVEAKQENLEQILEFVKGQLESAGCENGVRLQIDMAVEEIFVNIASYAYAANRGEVAVTTALSGEQPQIVIQFMDRGLPFNPLTRADPDITLPAGKRQIGGLGIYLVKQSMDQVDYLHDGTRNILTIHKKLSPNGCASADIPSIQQNKSSRTEIE